MKHATARRLLVCLKDTSANKKRLDAKKPLGKRTIAFPAVFYVSKTIKLRIPQVSGALEAPPRFELGVKDLQSSALPLGYVAVPSALRYNDIYYSRGILFRQSFFHDFFRFFRKKS